MEHAIEVSGLRKTYKLAKPAPDGSVEYDAVRDISFAVARGEIFGILGPNGAGKTTTLEIIEGIKRQSMGTVNVLGFDNWMQAHELKACIGVQLQSSNYLPNLTLLELLRLFASLYKKNKDPHELLSFVGLQDKANEYVKNLSGGQKQRFTIASTLVNDPAVIFLDEPTTGLDPRARRDVWYLVKEINKHGVTIVLTTHYMEEAEFLCHRVAIMDRGQILKIDEPKRLINDLAHTTQVSFLVSSEPAADIWKSIQNDIEKVYNQYPKIILEIKSLGAIGGVVEALRQNNIQFSGFTVRTASLEDVYLDLTGHSYQE